MSIVFYSSTENQVENYKNYQKNYQNITENYDYLGVKITSICDTKLFLLKNYIVYKGIVSLLPNTNISGLLLIIL